MTDWPWQRETEGNQRMIAAAAREYVEDQTGMPAYLVDDEDWAAAEWRAWEDFLRGDLAPIRPEAVRLEGWA